GGLVELDICYGLGRNAAAGNLEVFYVAVAVHLPKNLWIRYTGWAADQGNVVAGNFINHREAVRTGNARHLGRVRVPVCMSFQVCESIQGWPDSMSLASPHTECSDINMNFSSLTGHLLLLSAEWFIGVSYKPA